MDGSAVGTIHPFSKSPVQYGYSVKSCRYKFIFNWFWNCLVRLAATYSNKVAGSVNGDSWKYTYGSFI